MTLTIKKRNWRWITLCVVAACLGVVAPPARASFILTAQSVSAAAGDVNVPFNVYLKNNGPAVDVSSFNFEINTASSDIAFQQATTGTTLFPYIFAGNSFFGPVISTNGPGQTLDVSDIAADPNSFTTIGTGASFGLGEIFFNVAPGAGPEIVPVTFNISGAITSVSDINGNLQTLDFASGQITVGAVSTVPEPATFMLSGIVIGLSALALRRGAAAKLAEAGRS
jgi:hypothetical protein